MISPIPIETPMIADRPSVLPPRAISDDMVSDAVDIEVINGFEDAQIEGEPDLIVELIDLFLEDTPRKLAALQHAFMTGDVRGIQCATHSLKGSSANMGARQMASVCEKLEEMSRQETLEGLELMIARLKEEYERARQALASARKRRG